MFVKMVFIKVGDGGFEFIFVMMIILVFVNSLLFLFLINIFNIDGFLFLYEFNIRSIVVSDINFSFFIVSVMLFFLIIG